MPNHPFQILGNTLWYSQCILWTLVYSTFVLPISSNCNSVFTKIKHFNFVTISISSWSFITFSMPWNRYSLVFPFNFWCKDLGVLRFVVVWNWKGMRHLYLSVQHSLYYNISRPYLTHSLQHIQPRQTDIDDLPPALMLFCHIVL